jgi:hypothetical protein
MMDRVFVVTVGVEEYSSRLTAPPLPTAGPDAIRVAARLQTLGAAPENTYVFLAPTTRNDPEQADFDRLLEALKPKTNVSRSCTYQTINQFWRKELRELAAQRANNRLFMYWCGHGFTEVLTGLPALLCADWTEALNTNILNRNDFLESLHSQHYRTLRSQLILFDACANNVASGVIAGRTVTTWEDTIDQVCISSAARGEYASGDDRSSYFARIVMSLLNGYEHWPDLDDFCRDLQQAIAISGKKSTPVFYRRGRGDDLVWRRSNAGRDDLVSRLMQLPIAVSRYKPLYLSVLSSLAAGPGRGGAATIPQMVDDLWNANGSAAASRAPYPVVEFALRIRKAFVAAANIDPWIGNDIFVAPSDREEALRLLNDEENALYLVVEVIESKSQSRPGQIERFKAFLLHYDHVRAVEPWSTTEQLVRSWDDLEEKIRPLLNQAREIAETRDSSLTVEFVTNVFDIDPHRISLAKGEPDSIGEKNPVILRLRAQRSRDTRQPWIERANAIREGKVSKYLHPVTITSAKLEPCCVLFVRHALPRGSRPPHPDPLTPEWELVRRAVNAGVPYICWPLRYPETGDCSQYERELATWVKESYPFDRVVSRVRQERGAGTLARDLNVFWDDPLPTWQLREIRMG